MTCYRETRIEYFLSGSLTIEECVTFEESLNFRNIAKSLYSFFKSPEKLLHKQLNQGRIETISDLRKLLLKKADDFEKQAKRYRNEESLNESIFSDIIKGAFSIGRNTLKGIGKGIAETLWWMAQRPIGRIALAVAFASLEFSVLSRLLSSTLPGSGWILGASIGIIGSYIAKEMARLLSYLGDGYIINVPADKSEISIYDYFVNVLKSPFGSRVSNVRSNTKKRRSRYGYL